MGAPNLTSSTSTFSMSVSQNFHFLCPVCFLLYSPFLRCPLTQPLLISLLCPFTLSWRKKLLRGNFSFVLFYSLPAAILYSFPVSHAHLFYSLLPPNSSFSPVLPSESSLVMKNFVFWSVVPCRSCANRRFGGAYRLSLHRLVIHSPRCEHHLSCSIFIFVP